MVSVIAGKTTSFLSNLCGGASVVRIVLNTACLVGAGAITMAAQENTQEVFLIKQLSKIILEIGSSEKS